MRKKSVSCSRPENDRHPLDAVFPASHPRPGHIPNHMPRTCPQRQSRPAGSAGQLRAHPQTSARWPSQQVQGIPRPQPPVPALHNRNANRIRQHRDHYLPGSAGRHRRMDTHTPTPIKATAIWEIWKRWHATGGRSCGREGRARCG